MGILLVQTRERLIEVFDTCFDTVLYRAATAWIVAGHSVRIVTDTDSKPISISKVVRTSQPKHSGGRPRSSIPQEDLYWIATCDLSVPQLAERYGLCIKTMGGIRVAAQKEFGLR
jgi:hypothetical protein